MLVHVIHKREKRQVVTIVKQGWYTKMEKEMAPPFHTNYWVMGGNENEGETEMMCEGLAVEVQFEEAMS